MMFQKFRVLVTLLSLAIAEHVPRVRNKRDGLSLDVMESRLAETESTLSSLAKNFGNVARQLMLLQFYVEEMTRSNGDSGIGNIRNIKHGGSPYFSASHTDNRIATIHDHANNIRTIGLGEFDAVLNGVFFRTRHNDYRMMMKNLTSTEYGDIEDVPFPPVPPAVTKQATVDEQIVEMKEWFKAWAKQDDSVRDYKPYFKPVLCYLEGAWTNSDQTTIEESFLSDRHQLDAKSWMDMQDKARFTAYSGTKDKLENFAYLPTSIYSVRNETVPEIAQWNFKILCHPLKNDLPLNRLNLVDDLKARISMGLTIDAYRKSKAARFQISPENTDKFVNKGLTYSYLDDLMAEVPGPDSYHAKFPDNLMDQVAYPYDKTDPNQLNAAYYNRAYRVKEAGAQGLNIRHRGFSDQNLFVSQTTHPKIAGLPIEKCDGNNKNCKTWFQRWSYAIPLEIIYSTPLSSWNPYNIEYRGEATSKEGKAVIIGPNGKRNGGPTPDKAYDGTNSKLYYMTPLQFFQNVVNKDPADTTLDYTNVLDSSGTVRQVRATGYRGNLPNIPGVGILRQRYPIMPLHGEGKSIWKDHAALVDMVKNPSKYPHMYDMAERPVTGQFRFAGNCVQINGACNMATGGSSSVNDTDQKLLRFTLGTSPTMSKPHTHDIVLPLDKTTRYNMLLTVQVTTSETDGHTHDLEIQRKTTDFGKVKDLLVKCDDVWACKDGHPRALIRVDE